MNDSQHIRYPAPLRPGDTIGITAPSSGVAEACHRRLDLCIEHLRSLGFDVREGECLRCNDGYVSGAPDARARDLMALWTDPQIKAILPPWGGELGVGLLERIDFDAMAAATPTWILGYSDTSTLLFALTTRTGIATAHGTTLMEMVAAQADPLTRGWADVLAMDAGGRIEQRSSEAFQVTGPRWEQQPEAAFNLTEPTRWRCMQGGRDLDACSFRGRLIGGCVDTIAHLAGSPYGDLDAFKRRCAGDGVILYLENAECTPERLCRALWGLRLAGWLTGLTGLLLGRSYPPDGKTLTYLDALHAVLDDLPLAVIYDADLGHRPPQMTLVNGAVATVEATGGAGRVAIEFL